MGYLISLFSLSEEATSTALDVSEVVLCISGLLLLFGAVGEYLFDHDRLPGWMKWSKVIFEIIVAISLGGELLADGSVAIPSHRLQKLEGFDIQALDRKTRSATDKAGDALGKSSTAASKALSAEGASVRALDKSGKAEIVASGAMALARGARAEADTFNNRLVSAESKADEAESKVSEAVQRATEAIAALDRLRLPRTLTHIPELANMLRPLKETEYTFSGVFADEESRDFLKQIDAMLQLAGWKRIKQSGLNRGIPAFKVFGVEKDLVNMGASTGMNISVDSTEKFEVLQALPIERLPGLVRTGVLLNDGVFSNTSPVEEAKDKNRVDVQRGTSKVIRIDIGKKP
jgi:hypothetical protein